MTGSSRLTPVLRPAAFLLSLTAAVAGATPNHAHHHYHMGVRAYAGSKHAAMLHHEASAPDLDVTLARENAFAMEALAFELSDRAARLATVVSEVELSTIGAEIAEMGELARTARRHAAELGVWLDEAIAAGVPASEELGGRVTRRCRELFAGFRAILKAHKAAENALEIPVPEDPPAP